MADNTPINAMSGGDTIRDIDRAGVKTQVMQLDHGGAAGESLTSASNPLPVSVGNWPATQAVTGTFWQATQPVSGTVTANAGSGTFAVSAASLPLPTGAATAAKQPAFGTAGTASADVLTVQGIASMTALKVDGSAVTQPVSISGTLPVSGPLTDTQLRASAVPVSGTFWQTTQPVSIASMPSTPVTDNGGSLTVDAPVTTPVFVRLSDGAAAISTLPVSIAATVNVSAAQSGTWNIGSVTTLPSLAAGSAIIGKVGIDQTTPGTTNKVSIGTDGTVAATQSGTWNVGTVTTLTSITNAVATTAPAITKGTQGANGWTVQDLKDSGRTSIMVTASVASTATSETLITVSTSKGLAAVTTASSNTITTGKRFRIQGIFATARNSTGTTAGVATIRLRAAVGGATSASSPLQLTSAVALPAAATTVNFPTIDIPDGFEIDSNGATNTWGITITHPQWVTGSVVATFDITLIGYEY